MSLQQAPSQQAHAWAAVDADIAADEGAVAALETADADAMPENCSMHKAATGAALSSLISVVPGLVWVSEYKEQVFAFAGHAYGQRHAAMAHALCTLPARSSASPRLPAYPQDVRLALRPEAC